MSGWISLTDVFSPKQHDTLEPSQIKDGPSPYRQVSALRRGEAALLAELAEGRVRGEGWERKQACGPATAHYFHPPSVDPEDERVRSDRQLSRVEFDRDGRLDEARKLCAGCPVQPECLTFYMRLGGRDKYAFAAGTSWHERKQIATWVRIEAAGGCPIIDEVGWRNRRLLFRAMRSEAVGRSMRLVKTPEPQTRGGPKNHVNMPRHPTKCAMFTDTPWGVPVAVPYVDAWESLPALGRALAREANHRGIDQLEGRQIEAALRTLRIADLVTA